MFAKCVAAGVAVAVLLVGAPVASAKDTNTSSDRSSTSSSQSTKKPRPSEKVATRNPGANRITKDQARQIIREQGRQRVCSLFRLSCP